MSKQQLINQIENLESSKEQREEENQILKNDLKYLQQQQNSSKLYQDDLRTKLGKLNLQLKTITKENENFLKENAGEKQKCKKYQQEIEKVRLVLESQNRENFSGVKQIKHLYQGDPVVKQILEDNLKKQIAQISSTEKNLKQELKIHSIFCREFIKIIMYFKNVHRQSLELKKLQHSLGLSHMVRESELNRVSDLFNHSQVSESNKRPHVLQGIEEKMEELKKYFEIGQHRNLNVESEEFQIKINELKEEKNALNEQNFILSQKLYDAEKQSLNLLDLLEKSYTGLKKVTNPPQQSQFDIQVDSSISFDVSEFQRKVFMEKYDELLDYVNKELHSESENVRSKPQVLQLISSLEAELKQSKKAFYELGDKHQALQRQLMDSLQKQKYLEHNNRQPFVEENKEDEHMHHAVIPSFKEEIKAKNSLIVNLSEVNANLFKRLEDLQSERLEVLRDKQHCEDLYAYFKQKSDRIYMMNANLSRVIDTNQRLQQTTRNFLKVFDQLNNEFTTQYQLKDVLLGQIVDEFKQSLYLAQYHYDTFKTDDFDFRLKSAKKMLKKPEEDKNNQGASPAQNPKEEQEIEVVINKEAQELIKSSKSLNQSSAIDRENDPKLSNFDKATFAKTITQLNRTMIENENLKEKIELQNKKIMDLGKDIVLFQKKAKYFKEIEDQIDSMVGENLQLKNILAEFQLQANEKSKDMQDEIKGFQNFVDVQNEVLEKTKQFVKDLQRGKKQAEKNVFTLERKLEEKTKQQAQFATTLTFREQEIQKHMRDKQVKQDEIDNLLREMMKKQEEFDNAKIDLDQKQKTIESLNQTIVLLEKNLYNLTQTKSGDADTLRKEITEQKKALMDKQFQEKNQLQKVVQMEKQITSLQNSLKEREAALKDKTEEIKSFELKEKELRQQIEDLEEEKRELNRQLVKKEIEKDSLKYQKEAEVQKNDVLRNDVKNTIQNNNNNLDGERRRMNEQLKKQWQEKMDENEYEIQKLKKLYGEAQYEKGKAERELEDADIKLSLRNKQLVHFYSYFLKNDQKGSPVGELQSFIVQNKDLLREVELLRTQNQQLQKLYDDLQISIDKDVIENPKTKLQKMDERIENLKASFIDDSSKRDPNFQHEVQQVILLLEEKVDFQEKLLKNQQQKIEATQSLLQKTQNEKVMKEEQFEEASMELKALQNNYKENSVENQNQEKMIQELKTKIGLLEKEQENKKTFGDQYQTQSESSQEIARLRHMNLEQQKRINELEQKLREKNKEINKLDESLYKPDLNQSQFQQVAVLKQMNKDLEQENKELKEMVASKESDLILLENRLKETNPETLDELNVKIKQETLKRQDSERNLTELKGITNELQEHQMSQIQQIEQLRNKLKDLEGENEDLMDEIEVSKKVFSGLNDKIKILNKEKLLIANHINNLKRENERLKKEQQLQEELMFELETDLKQNLEEGQKKYLENLQKDMKEMQRVLKAEQEHSDGLIRKSQEISDLQNAQIEKLELLVGQLQQEVKKKKEEDYF